MSDDTEAQLPLPPEVFDTPELRRELARAILEERYERYPRLWEALEEDTKAFLSVRGEKRDLPTRLAVLREAARLSWDTDAFLGLLLYRIRGRLLARRVPALPKVLHRACMTFFQINIGEPVIIEPGVYIPHGQVVIDGMVEIGTGAILTPWIAIGLVPGNPVGPTIGRRTAIGTGAKILGNVKIGSHASIGANSVVVRDVPAFTTVMGAPARPVRKQPPRRPKDSSVTPARQRPGDPERQAVGKRPAESSDGDAPDGD